MSAGDVPAIGLKGLVLVMVRVGLDPAAKRLYRTAQGFNPGYTYPATRPESGARKARFVAEVTVWQVALLSGATFRAPSFKRQPRVETLG